MKLTAQQIVAKLNEGKILNSKIFYDKASLHFIIQRVKSEAMYETIEKIAKILNLKPDVMSQKWIAAYSR